MTKNVLIIGATGTVGSAVTRTLLDKTDANLTLFSRHAQNHYQDSERITVLNGDVLSQNDIATALKNVDFVFAALSGAVDKMADSLITALDAADVKRFALISSMGIYNEIPATINYGNLDVNPILKPFRRAADLVETSDLDYTIIRPGWFTDGPVDYEITQKGEPFGGRDVSVSSIADLVRRLVVEPDFSINTSLGLDTPGS